MKNITVNVTAGAKVTKVSKLGKDTYKVHLMTEPVRGKANRQLIKILADFFKIKPGSISIISGLQSKKKIIRINEG
jgi:uncharacterized protein (TIGR00251 family)